jgi:hypothetical protein
MLFKYKLEEMRLKDSGNNFKRYIVVKIYEDREDMMAYSDITGRLYVPNHPPTLFTDMKTLKGAIKKTQEHLKKTNPTMEKKSEYQIYKIEFIFMN